MPTEKEYLVLNILQQLSKPIKREDLFKKIKLVQEENNTHIFNMVQRTVEHFYCEELSVELQKLVFRGLVSLDTEWNGEYFDHYFGSIKDGEAVLQDINQERLRNELSRTKDAGVNVVLESGFEIIGILKLWDRRTILLVNCFIRKFGIKSFRKEVVVKENEIAEIHLLRDHLILEKLEGLQPEGVV